MYVEKFLSIRIALIVSGCDYFRFPFVCVSIGLTIGRVPTVGVVYNPIMDEVSSTAAMGLTLIFVVLSIIFRKLVTRKEFL